MSAINLFFSHKTALIVRTPIVQCVVRQEMFPQSRHICIQWDELLDHIHLRVLKVLALIVGQLCDFMP